MEILKRKILLENSIDRTYQSPNWGTVTASTFYINVFLTQNIDDMGLFTDIDFVPNKKGVKTPPDYSILIDKLSASGITFPFMQYPTSPIMTGMTGTTKIVNRIPSSIESDYYNFGNLLISGSTDSKIDDVRSYNRLNPYRISFNTSEEVYDNYNNVNVNSVSRIKSMGNPRIYVFDTIVDTNLGTPNQIYGLQYHDYSGITRTFDVNSESVTIPLTNFYYKGEGWNNTNTSLSALTKEEYLFGIISPPEVQSDVFIDRGKTTVMDMHLRLSEIKSLDELVRYGNGFYKINKQ